MTTRVFIEGEKVLEASGRKADGRKDRAYRQLAVPSGYDEKYWDPLEVTDNGEKGLVQKGEFPLALGGRLLLPWNAGSYCRVNKDNPKGRLGGYCLTPAIEVEFEES